jgi:hypothetical protein
LNKITSELIVFLKDVDLVATTAFLTLTGKMGYAETLLGLKRFDYFRFLLGCSRDEDPESVVDRLTRILSSQSTFYNRNKHYYHLSSAWNDTCVTRGTDLEIAERRLGADISNSLKNNRDREMGVQSGSEMINLNGDTAFLAKLLVQERESAGKKTLSARLQSELAGRSAECTDRGVMWWLALRAGSRAQAEQIIEEISVTVKRDKGLLVNPNYQSFALLAVTELDLNHV